MSFLNNRYKKMFEGYEHQTFFDANGKRVTKMVYIGPRYEAQLGGRQRIVYKVLYGVLWLAGLAFTIISGILKIPANFMTYVNAGSALSIVSGIILAIYVFTYMAAIPQMEMSTYKRAHGRLKLLALISGLITAATAIMAAIAMFITKNSGNFLSWLCAILLLLAAAAYLIMFFLEHRTEYIIC